VRQDADFLTALRKLPSVYDCMLNSGPQREPNICSICSASTKLTSQIDNCIIAAVDLCSRISAAATYQFPDGKPFSFRSACVIHTLFYSGVGMCSELPSIRDRDFPLLSNYDSTESCSDSIRTDRCPGLGELPDAKPIFFPLWSPFNRPSMKSATAPGQNPATMPKPTFNDYLEFFCMLPRRGVPNRARSS
jgi:hypothetical protein